MRVITWLVSLPFIVLAYVLFILALLAAAYDAWLSVEAHAFHTTPLGSLWFAIDPGSLNLSQAVVQRYVAPALWDPGIQWLLLRPSWLSLGLVAALFLLVARVIHHPR